MSKKKGRANWGTKMYILRLSRGGEGVNGGSEEKKARDEFGKAQTESRRTTAKRRGQGRTQKESQSLQKRSATTKVPAFQEGDLREKFKR